MLKCVVGLIGLAWLGGGPLFAQVPGASPCLANKAACCGESSCAVSDQCCSRCGCRLVAVCHSYCDTKKETTYQYGSVCKEICVPGPGHNCNDCDTCKHECHSGFGGGCSVHQVKKQVKYAVTKNVPVRKCTVEWVCPQCSDCRSTVAPAAPSPVNPAPVIPTAPLPPKAVKTSPLPPRGGFDPIS